LLLTTAKGLAAQTAKPSACGYRRLCLVPHASIVKLLELKAEGYLEGLVVPALPPPKGDGLG
jgi:hypothetical protein